jgi:HAE1 family hydrophobic/amphiphilic exporter-1
VLSRFFIHRPIFASVISIVIVIAGLVSQSALPIAKFPEITPPTVQVSCYYPGANAQVVADTVAAPIEQEVNGVENMLYLSSVSSDDGSYALTVTFEIGVDMDMATVLVQNRVAIAMAKLPEEVRRQGVTTKKQSTSIIQFVALTSSNPSHDALFLGNFATRSIKDEISRIPGVGSVTVFGASDYSMRLWLNPELLEARAITTEDVVAAISEQNVQVAAGRLGEPPATADFELVINTLGRLSEVEQFKNLIVKTVGSRITRIQDVARVELGAKDYKYQSSYNGQPCATLSIYQLPGANALELAQQVQQTLAQLERNFPAGLRYDIPFDTTKFVEVSIHEVFVTLLTAVALVVLVIYLFLQDWRTTIVPCAAIPVALIGTFAVLALLGFSINTLTLFGVVLAIGIVVDDAIVVVENVDRFLSQGLAPKQAAEKAMEEITGPVIATTLVLLAVFVPTAFMGGITGQLYRQFALTISAAVLLSTINALTLSPALCGILMRKSTGKKNIAFRAFNTLFDRVTQIYGALIGSLVHRVALVLVGFAGLLVLTGWGYAQIPTGFLPTEDQGYCFANLQLPDAASQSRTAEVMAQLDQIVQATPGVRDWVSVVGYSLLSSNNGGNLGLMAIIYDPWEQRTTPELSQAAILAHLRREFSQVQSGLVVAFAPPPIDGLGSAGGFQMQLQDQGGVGLSELQAIAQQLVVDGNSQAGLTGLSTSIRAHVPQLFLDVDRTKVKTLDVPLSSVFNTLQAYLGSTYINDFNKLGRVYQVRIQADHDYRSEPSDIRRLHVRNRQGEMVPIGTFVNIQEALGPQVVQRYLLYPAAQINGEPAAGFSSGQAMQMMESLAQQNLPPAVSYRWTGMSYQEQQAGGGQALLFGLAVVFVFLVLAAQYESWTSPAAVIAVVPLAVLGVVLALAVRQADNNVYTQIGIVLLVALASKNAILIVEFASELRRTGLGIRAAAKQAAEMRFRAILMTAFSSILGFMPLLIATGAGAASRQAVGNAVVGGMCAATLFSLLLVPTFFVVFRSLSERFSPVALAEPVAE